MSSEFQALNPLFTPEVSVIISTFGDESWGDRGFKAAMDTFDTQSHVPETIWVHGDTLAQARNRGADLASCPWLVFLDADDQLDRDYCTSILRRCAIEDILQPSVRGYRLEAGDHPYDPLRQVFIEDAPVFVPQEHPLIRQNYLTIGSPIRRDLFLHVGGFDEWPCLEDWGLWLKCQKAGARFGTVPEAVYLINDDHDRNYTGNQYAVAQAIREKYK